MRRGWHMRREKVHIGIPCGRIQQEGRALFCLAEVYSRALIAQGALPQLLPISSLILAEEYTNSIDGLLLPGGGDVDPLLYGAEPTCARAVDRERDEWEIALVRTCQQAQKPILGICRGLQVINVALGGTLQQDIEGHQQEDTRRDRTSHIVNLAAKSHWRGIFGVEEIAVNSYHHQAVKALAPGLMATAHAPDGVIEGVESPDGTVLALQCHPECLWQTNPIFGSLFAAFVEKAGAFGG